MILYSAGHFTFPRDAGPAIELPQNLNVLGYARIMRQNPDAILVLEGGADISPSIYGEAVTHAYGLHPRRDYTEMTQLIAARLTGTRVLGICRGHQLLAAAQGGALWQDFQHETGVVHHSWHELTLTEDAEHWGFSAMLNADGYPPVNSLHHQSVKTPPKDALILATYRGVNEALLYPNVGLGVQWHPEFLGHVDILEYVREIVMPVRAKKDELRDLVARRASITLRPART